AAREDQAGGTEQANGAGEELTAEPLELDRARQDEAVARRQDLGSARTGARGQERLRGLLAAGREEAETRRQQRARLLTGRVVRQRAGNGVWRGLRVDPRRAAAAREQHHRGGVS